MSLNAQNSLKIVLHSYNRLLHIFINARSDAMAGSKKVDLSELSTYIATRVAYALRTGRVQYIYTYCVDHMHASTHVHTHTHTHTHTYTHTCTCTHTYMYVHTHTYVHTRTRTRTHTYMYMHTQMYVHTRTRTTLSGGKN